MISLSLSLLRTVVGLDHMAWHVVSTITLCCYKDNNTAMAASVSTIGAIKGTLINSLVGAPSRHCYDNSGEFEWFWSCGFISSQFISFLWKQLKEGSSRIPNISKVSTGSFKIVAIDEDKQTDKDRCKGLAYDISNDQQDITRRKGIL
ncbi:hypothetical protein HN51_062458 [Arachis hypogaea]